jgi:CDP-diacylglycerol--serine O-phosphatidyltransferase
MIPEKSTIRRRAIYLLPNLFTTGALFAGFYAITSAMGGQFVTATVAIFAAMILDGLDGRVARLTNTQSEFGAQYDSLSDMVSFGAAPALVMYLWAFSSLGKLGLCAAFIHMAGGALRLARFNTQLTSADKRYFQGLPSPAAAAILAGFIWFSIELLTFMDAAIKTWERLSISLVMQYSCRCVYQSLLDGPAWSGRCQRSRNQTRYRATIY